MCKPIVDGSRSGRGLGFGGAFRRAHARELASLTAALGLAAVAFWVVMFTTPPLTEAGPSARGISIDELMRGAAPDLPSAEYDTH